MWLTVVLLCLVVGYIWKRIHGHHEKLPPGPFNIPLLGSWELIRLWFTGGSMTEMYARLGEKYGPVIFMRTVLDAPVVAIRQHDAIMEASKDIRLNGSTVPYFFRLMSGWSNYGISFSDGPKWHHSKKFTIATLGKLGFTKERVVTMATTECSNAIDTLLELNGSPVNIEHQLFGAITNVIMEVLMSRQFDINDPLFVQMREDGLTLFSIAAKLKSPYDFAPWLARFAGESSDVATLNRVMERFYVFCDQVIDEHEASLCPDEPRDFVEAYLAAMRTAPASHDMSKANLRVLLKDQIVGGMEGPSIILAWLLLLMAEHSDVQARMVAEVDEVIGTDRTPKLEDERACPYVRAVIVETLRFVTLTPIHRHSTSQGASLLGFHIPDGSIMLEDVHSVNHELAVWGDPEVFRPERFLGPDGDRLRRREATFGFSARQCPAITYSYTVLFLFAAGLLQRLKLRLPDGAAPQSDRGAYNVGVRPSQPLLIALPR